MREASKIAVRDHEVVAAVAGMLGVLAPAVKHTGDNAGSRRRQSDGVGLGEIEGALGLLVNEVVGHHATVGRAPVHMHLGRRETIE